MEKQKVHVHDDLILLFLLFSVKSWLIFIAKINLSLFIMLSHCCNIFRQSTIQCGGIDTDFCLHDYKTFLDGEAPLPAFTHTWH